MDDALKKRLLGAVVLLAIAAIVWPLVFDSAEEIKLSAESKIPPRPEVERWQPAEVPEPDASSVGWPDNKPDDKRAEQTTSRVATQRPATKQPQDKLAATATATRKPAATTPSAEQKPLIKTEQKPLFRPAWVVQVATLSNGSSATQLVEKLRTNNYRAYSEVAELSGKQAYRVLIGPKFDKRKALSIKQEIDKSEKVDSLILNFRPK